MELTGPNPRWRLTAAAPLKGVFLVPKDSPIESLAAQRKKIAYVAKSSQGYIVQSYTLRQAGVDPAIHSGAVHPETRPRGYSCIEGKADAAECGRRGIQQVATQNRPLVVTRSPRVRRHRTGSS